MYFVLVARFWYSVAGELSSQEMWVMVVVQGGLSEGMVRGMVVVVVVVDGDGDGVGERVIVIVDVVVVDGDGDVVVVGGEGKRVIVVVDVVVVVVDGDGGAEVVMGWRNLVNQGASGPWSQSSFPGGQSLIV